MVGRQNADIADTLHLRNVSIATTFWLLMGYNFCWMIASDTLFDSRGGFIIMQCVSTEVKPKFKSV